MEENNINKCKILVVDDEEVIRELLIRTLESKGFNVETVENGLIALEKIKTNVFDVLITDLKMPKINGIDVLKEIKKSNPFTEVIIITGYPTIEAAVEAMRIGAADFISKPFDLETIHSIIKRILEKQKVGINYLKLSELEALLNIYNALIVTNDLEYMLESVLDAALEITKSKRGSILLLEKETQELRIKAARGLSQEIIDTTRIKIGEGLSGKVAQEGVLLSTDDIERDTTAKIQSGLSRYESEPFVSIPIKRHSQKDVLGVINLTNRISKEKFTARELVLLTVVAGHLAVIIENSNLYNYLQDNLKDLKQTVEELKTTQTQLIQSEKLAALGRFASGVAHEVKNPLGIILGGMEYLEFKMPDAKEEAKIAMQKIKESTLRADVIVQNLLKLSRPSELKTEKMNPEDLIKETMSLFKFTELKNNIKIATDFTQGQILVDVDKNQMQQVLFNVLMNAVEAMQKGGEIKIKVYRAVTTEIPSQKEYCVIEISDTGEGIAKENLAKMFEPFFTTKKERKGNGLGLSISKMIVERHNGSLTIESEPGKGAEVKIVLPAAN